MKKLIISVFVAAFVMLGASDVFACSCVMDPEKSESKKVNSSYQQAAAVFYGEVTEITRQADSLVVKFKVAKAWKGISAKETIVRTGENSAMCGFNFEVGKRYTVYAFGESGSLETGLCSRTSARKSDAKYLNRIKKSKSFN